MTKGSLNTNYHHPIICISPRCVFVGRCIFIGSEAIISNLPDTFTDFSWDGILSGISGHSAGWSLFVWYFINADHVYVSYVMVLTIVCYQSRSKYMLRVITVFLFISNLGNCIFNKNGTWWYNYLVVISLLLFSQRYIHLGMVIFDILDIRGHTQVKDCSEYHHAINGYWVVDNLGDSQSTSWVIAPVTEITKVTKNNTSYIREVGSKYWKLIRHSHITCIN